MDNIPIPQTTKQSKTSVNKVLQVRFLWKTTIKHSKEIGNSETAARYPVNPLVIHGPCNDTFQTDLKQLPRPVMELFLLKSCKFSIPFSDQLHISSLVISTLMIPPPPPFLRAITGSVVADAMYVLQLCLAMCRNRRPPAHVCSQHSPASVRSHL